MPLWLRIYNRAPWRIELLSKLTIKWNKNLMIKKRNARHREAGIWWLVSNRGQTRAGQTGTRFGKQTNKHRPKWNHAFLQVFAKIREQKIGKVRTCWLQKTSLIIVPDSPTHLSQRLSTFWSHLFTQITVFFCGNPTLGKMLKGKCDEFGFTFRFHQIKHQICFPLQKSRPRIIRLFCDQLEDPYYHLSINILN